MSKIRKNGDLNSRKRNVTSPIKSATDKPSIKFTLQSVQTGKPMELVFVGSCFQQPNWYVVGYVAPRRQRDWLFRGAGVTDEEWSLALPFLQAARSDGSQAPYVLAGPLEHSERKSHPENPHVSRPRRYSEGQLAKVGVELVSVNHGVLKCNACGQKWSPMIRRGGKMPRGYWQCPNGCNRE